MKAASSRTSAAQGHGVLDALEFDGGAVDEFEFQIRLIFAPNPCFRDQLFEQFPYNIFAHTICRSTIKERFAGSFDSAPDKFHAREVALTETATCNEHTEAFAAAEDLALGVPEA
jgi:hypothetical protein